jgi:Raf kinase inhibitor-like YbhB/YbcL family protein
MIRSPQYLPTVTGRDGTQTAITYDRGVRRRPALLPLAAMATVALVVPACSSDGDDSSDPTTATFTLTSSAFDEGEEIPPEHGLDGGNVSPPLEWVGVPSGAKELAITVVDPDASNFVHWVVWGIDPSDGSIDAGTLPPGATAGLNQFGDLGWGGPAPPAGDEHTYVLTIHALSRSPGIDENTPAIEAVQAIDEVTTVQAELRGQFMSS